jgi:hypothetical protein
MAGAIGGANQWQRRDIGQRRQSWRRGCERLSLARKDPDDAHHQNSYSTSATTLSTSALHVPVAITNY